MITTHPGGELHDDSEIDLPPSDGPTGDEEDLPASDASDSDDLDPVPADAGRHALDDETGEDDPVGEDELDPVDEGGLDDAEADPEKDADLYEVADLAGNREDQTASMLTENDELGVGNEDFGIAEDDSSGAIDGGEEGPGEADEELREEDLPALDADDQGDGDEGAFYELEGDSTPPFPWEEERWPSRKLEHVPAAVAVVSVASGAVAIAGDPPKLWGIVENGAESSEPRGAPREGWRSLRLARRTGELFIDTDTGVFVSRDGGRHFAKQDEGSELPHARTQSLRDMEKEIAARGFDLRGLKVGAAAITDEAGTILAAVASKSGEGGPSWLVRFSANGVGASLRATLPGCASAARTLGIVRGVVWDLSWDEPRGRVWVASDDGVTLFTRPSA